MEAFRGTLSWKPFVTSMMRLGARFGGGRVDGSSSYVWRTLARAADAAAVQRQRVGDWSAETWSTTRSTTRGGALLCMDLVVTQPPVWQVHHSRRGALSGVSPRAAELGLLRNGGGRAAAAPQGGAGRARGRARNGPETAGGLIDVPRAGLARARRRRSPGPARVGARRRAAAGARPPRRTCTVTLSRDDAPTGTQGLCAVGAETAEILARHCW